MALRDVSLEGQESSMGCSGEGLLVLLSFLDSAISERSETIGIRVYSHTQNVRRVEANNVLGAAYVSYDRKQLWYIPLHFDPFRRHRLGIAHRNFDQVLYNSARGARLQTHFDACDCDIRQARAFDRLPDFFEVLIELALANADTLYQSAIPKHKLIHVFCILQLRILIRIGPHVGFVILLCLFYVDRVEELPSWLPDRR
jgi:hypothetical protein